LCQITAGDRHLAMMFELAAVPQHKNILRLLVQDLRQETFCFGKVSGLRGLKTYTRQFAQVGKPFRQLL